MRCHVLANAGSLQKSTPTYDFFVFHCWMLMTHYLPFNSAHFFWIKTNYGRKSCWRWHWWFIGDFDGSLSRWAMCSPPVSPELVFYDPSFFVIPLNLQLLLPHRRGAELVLILCKSRELVLGGEADSMKWFYCSLSGGGFHLYTLLQPNLSTTELNILPTYAVLEMKALNWFSIRIEN